MVVRERLRIGIWASAAALILVAGFLAVKACGVHTTMDPEAVEILQDRLVGEYRKEWPDGVRPVGDRDAGADAAAPPRRVDCAAIDPAGWTNLPVARFAKDLAIDTDAQVLRLLDLHPTLICATLHSNRIGDADVLSYAVEHRPHLETGLAALIERGATPDRALEVAARRGKSRAAEWLLAAGADADSGDALIEAAAAREHAIVRSLLAAGADPRRTLTEDSRLPHAGRTALHFAAEHGDVAIMTMLLDAGADPDAWNAWSGPPLEPALAAGQRGAVELLLERGAQPMLLSGPSRDRLRRLAKRWGRYEVLERLDGLP